MRELYGFSETAAKLKGDLEYCFWLCIIELWV